MARLFRKSVLIGLQESDRSASDSEPESKVPTKEDTPVGLRTRSRTQQQPTVCNSLNEEGSDKPIEPEIKELLLQLISQAKEHKLEMKELRLAFEKGLEQQESIVLALKGDIAALHEQIKSQKEEKIEVQLPISDHQPLVKLFEPSDKLSNEESPRQQELSADTKRGPRDSPNLDNSQFRLKSAIKQDAIQKTDPSTLRAKAYMAKATLHGAPSDIDSSELNSRSSIESFMNRDASQDTSSNLGSLGPNSRLSMMSYMSNETKSSKDTSSHREDRGYSRLSSKQSQRHSEHATSRGRSWKQGGEPASKSRADPFVPPKETDAVREKADQMIENALNQVSDDVHFNAKSKKTEVTLFAGNLDFKADAGDAMKSLQKYFRHRIRVTEIAIPNSNGRTKGYAFITLSWVRDAPVDPEDICKFYSGVIQVKARQLYFQELRDVVADKERERARFARLIGLQQKPSTSGYYCC
jgi:hypothetical protein